MFYWLLMALVVAPAVLLPDSMSTDALSLSAFDDSSSTALWALRAASAVTSYVGIIAIIDRPRGKLLYPDHLVVQESTVPGAGLGLFAAMDLPKGTSLGTYPGVLLPLQQNLSKLRAYPACEGFIWRFSDNRFVIDPTNSVGELDDVVIGGNPSLPGSLWLFRNVFSKIRTVPTALCRINEPPKGRDVNIVTDEDLKKRTVIFSVERDVAAGEELFIDYGLSYDRSMYGDIETPS